MTGPVRLRADFGRREVVDCDLLPWQASPLPGVERRMLDRIGDEVARATSIVRYAAGAAFAPHEHPLGEEFLVLEGCFEDEHGCYPTGHYVRNPPGSRHAPGSRDGCTIFVKLRQFAPNDRQRRVVDTCRGAWYPGPADGISVQALHDFGTERVVLQRWHRDARLGNHRHAGGAEVLVLEGAWQDEFGRYPAGTWLRLPADGAHAPHTSEGCLLWLKSGHLGALAG